jgi:hypothetical protein
VPAPRNPRPIRNRLPSSEGASLAGGRCLPRGIAPGRNHLGGVAPGRIGNREPTPLRGRSIPCGRTVARARNRPSGRIPIGTEMPSWEEASSARRRCLPRGIAQGGIAFAESPRTNRQSGTQCSPRTKHPVREDRGCREESPIGNGLPSADEACLAGGPSRRAQSCFENGLPSRGVLFG